MKADVCTHATENNISGCGLELEEARYHIVLVSRHGGFLPVSFVYSRIFIF